MKSNAPNAFSEHICHRDYESSQERNTSEPGVDPTEYSELKFRIQQCADRPEGNYRRQEIASEHKYKRETINLVGKVFAAALHTYKTKNDPPYTEYYLYRRNEG